MHVVIVAGHTEGDRYYVKNPESLWQDREFPLPSATACTSCKVLTMVPDTLPTIINQAAEEFATGLREIRESEDEVKRN